MSIANHFDHDADTGFARRRLTRDAGRQFQVSLALVILLACAAVAVSVSSWLNPGVASASITRLVGAR